MVIVAVRGVRVRATPGWLMTYLLLVATLVLWRELPAASLGPALERTVAVVLVPTLLLPTIVVHELSHVFVARRQGIRVQEVDLRLAGMTRGNASAPDGPVGEARIALAGPVVSLAIGIPLMALAGALEHGAGWAPLAAWTLGCVGAANLVLGLASLYPGYPMDGSDLVHAIAWRATGSQRRAARSVMVVGVASGWVVMLVGLVVAFRIDPSTGMWVTLLGWSLGRISRAARDHDRLDELVSGLTVADAIERDVAVVTPTLTLDTVLDQHRFVEGPGMFPVVRGGALLGVIEIRDVGGGGRPGTDLRVADRMRAIDRVQVVTEGQRLWDAVAILERDHVNAVPVVAPDDRRRLVGLVTRSAVQRLLRSRIRRASAGDSDGTTSTTTTDGSPDV
jgi:CBS domain-containing protein